MIEKSYRCVDEAAVKKVQESWTTWTATCPVCGVELTGTLAKLRCHKHGE